MLAFALIAFATAGAPSTELEQALLAPQMAELADSLARCSGVWESLSRAFADEKPATSQDLHNKANGAATSAMWLLSMRYNLKHPEDQQTLGSFKRYVDNLAELETTEFLADAENDRGDRIAAKTQACGSMGSESLILDESLVPHQLDATPRHARGVVVLLDPQRGALIAAPRCACWRLWQAPAACAARPAWLGA